MLKRLGIPPLRREFHFHYNLKSNSQAYHTVLNYHVMETQNTSHDHIHKTLCRLKSLKATKTEARYFFNNSLILYAKNVL